MLDILDKGVLTQAIDDVARSSATEAMARLVAGDSAEITAICELDHHAVLVFPDDPDDVVEFLAGQGVAVAVPVPSVVVRERLASRYGREAEHLDVSIVFGSVAATTGAERGIEVFCVPRGQAGSVMIETERQQRNEFHVALAVDDAQAMSTVRSALVGRFGLTPDGGGHNPFHSAKTGGRSVLYFSSPRGRLELTCAGDAPDVVAEHLRNTAAETAAHELLHILSRQWAARAVYAAAKLGLADVLAQTPCTANELALRVDADVDAMTRLLRYLDHLGVVQRDASDGYRLGDLGGLLRSTSPFHAMVVLYGEEFHQAWYNFIPAVRTGASAFGITFGAEHFDYFATHPELSEKFDLAMSALTGPVAAQISTGYEFAPGATVVDVGGGDGTLLRVVLDGNPGTKGILVDLPHVLRGLHVEPDLDGRLASHPGDFFDQVPAGHDIYLLSRVLHDWSDEECVRILQVCRAACRPDSTLLVVERLLPEDDGESLARAWDMQMLAITGGRERQLADYGRLMAKADFTLQEIRPLKLDLRLLVGRP